jgi:tRNA(Ile)-lysidine synthase
MAASRKSRRADLVGRVRTFLEGRALEGRRVAVGLSGGVDSIVLLHALNAVAGERGFALRAIHVHHGLSPNADAWARFCRNACAELGVPITVRRVEVGSTRGRGLEAAARDARRAVFASLRADVLVLAHHRDDQAETVLLNLLRGAGLAGASGIAPESRLGRLPVLRPLLDAGRDEILAYADARSLRWIEDESNADTALARNFLRHEVAPRLDRRFPGWRGNLARAARLFADERADERSLLRAFLEARGLRAPTEAKLAEMLRQIAQARPGARVAIEHDGKLLRRYRESVRVEDRAAPVDPGGPVAWRGEPSLRLPGGVLHFDRAPGGIDEQRLRGRPVVVRRRRGGERLRLAAGRPSRTLKNLFQEAGVPPWERERLPLVFCGEDLVWVATLGVDASYRASPAGASVNPRWVPD